MREVRQRIQWPVIDVHDLANTPASACTHYAIAGTRDELLPYLIEFVDDDDDILLVLAEMLGTDEMFHCVGNAPYLHTLLPPLSHLVATDESVVRDVAIKSVAHIIECMPSEQ